MLICPWQVLASTVVDDLYTEEYLPNVTVSFLLCIYNLFITDSQKAHVLLESTTKTMLYQSANTKRTNLRLRRPALPLKAVSVCLSVSPYLPPNNFSSQIYRINPYTTIKQTVFAYTNTNFRRIGHFITDLFKEELRPGHAGIVDHSVTSNLLITG